MSLLGSVFSSKESIFVQIASYRDSELVPTVKDLFKNAAHPENLRVVIAWQHSSEENIDEIRHIPGVEIVDIDYKLSKGVGWARNLLNQKYNREKYTLQIDSHHRFIENWDTELIKMYNQVKTKHNKVVLSTYPPSYNPENDPKERKDEVWEMRYNDTDEQGIPNFIPEVIKNPEKFDKPQLSRYIAGGFLFSSGEFVAEVPYDPIIYFTGEEITMTVRAYTNGYDIYFPHKTVCWHYYTRDDKPKHWNDNNDWKKYQQLSLDRVKKVLEIDNTVCTPCMRKNMGVYYLGKVRSKREYEEYAGFHFQSRGVDEYTLSHNPAPNPKVKNFDGKFLKKQSWGLMFHRELLEGREDFDFWAIILKDENGGDIHRQDLDGDTIKLILEDKNEVLNINGMYTGRDWSQWIVWPYKDDWLTKIIGRKA